MAHTLIERLQAGEEAAVAELAAAYSDKIFRTAFRHLRSREDAEEVVQDVLLTVARKAGTFRGDAVLSTWIYRIAFNAAMTRLRRQKAREPLRAPRQETPEVSRSLARRVAVDRDAWPDAQVHRAQLRRRIGRAIRGLPPAYRAPVVLRDVRGLSTAQAGRLLSVKPQTLKSRLHRGHLMLRERLLAP